MKESEGQTDPATRQPTKAELEELIVIDATPDQIAKAVLAGGAARRVPADNSRET